MPNMDAMIAGLDPFLIQGQIESAADDSVRLTIPASSSYANAQLDDYQGLARGAFSWRPPVQMRVRARASEAEPLGTLGFGFWNDPFSLSLGQGGAQRRLPAMPQALWFFYGSQPNDFTLVEGQSGMGWKAMSLYSPALAALLLAPAAPLALLGLKFAAARGPVLGLSRRVLRAAEISLDARLDDWHEYALTWERQEARFEVDGLLVLRAPSPPQGPLGFVLWIDNQYLLAGRESGFGFGVIETRRPQWLQIAHFDLRAL
jgi:hypothetical protein